MKKILLLLVFMFVIASVSFVAGQVEPPSVPDNASPVDNGIKQRSIELERVKREAEKTATIRRDNGTELNFSVIKADFEGIQNEQMAIITAYTSGDSVDYKAIRKSSNKITEMAVRLRANVFSGKKNDDQAVVDAEKEEYDAKSVRDLIVALDNAIGEVVSNSMWQNLKVVDPAVSETVETDLVRIINASHALWIECGKKLGK